MLRRPTVQRGSSEYTPSEPPPPPEERETASPEEEEGGDQEPSHGNSDQVSEEPEAEMQNSRQMTPGEGAEEEAPLEFKTCGKYIHDVGDR